MQIQNDLSYTTYKDARRLTDGTMQYHFVGEIHHRYHVYEEGWHNVDIQICTDDSIYLSSRLQGEVEFKNPYGYVPAEQWGIIPFEVRANLVYSCSFALGMIDILFVCSVVSYLQTIRAAVTVLLAAGYAVLCYIHRVRMRMQDVSLYFSFTFVPKVHEIHPFTPFSSILRTPC